MGCVNTKNNIYYTIYIDNNIIIKNKIIDSFPEQNNSFIVNDNVLTIGGNFIIPKNSIVQKYNGYTYGFYKESYKNNIDPIIINQINESPIFVFIYSKYLSEINQRV